MPERQNNEPGDSKQLQNVAAVQQAVQITHRQQQRNAPREAPSEVLA